MPRFLIEEFAKDVREKNGNTGVRELAKLLELSPSTISRIQNEKMPDLPTYAIVCKWLNKDMSHYIEGVHNNVLQNILTELVDNMEYNGHAMRSAEWKREMIKKIKQL